MVTHPHLEQEVVGSNPGRAILKALKVVPVATFLTVVPGVGSSTALASYETRQVLLAGVSGGFPGVLPFCPTCRLARLYE